MKKNNIEYNTVNYISQEELASIIDDYKDGMSPKELSIKYNRSDGYLINVLRKQNVYQEQNLHLSEQDWNKISELYQQGENDQIQILYPQLSKSSLQSKMSKLGIKSGNRNWWSDEDKKIVADLYYTDGTDKIYELINHRHSKDAIETFALKELNYNKGKKWTDKEDKIFKENYSTKPIDVVMSLLPNRTHEAILNRARKYGLKSYYRKTTYWSDEENAFLKDNWEKMSDYQIGLQLNRDSMSVKDRRSILGYYRISKDLLGYETIKKLFRARIWEWKQKSMESCNYQCVLTGDKEFHIHHLYGFSDIFNQFVFDNNIIEQDVSCYSYEELEEMCDNFVLFHDTYPLGICVRPDLHMLFHEIYGKHNNSPEQWNEFSEYVKNNITDQIIINQ